LNGACGGFVRWLIGTRSSLRYVRSGSRFLSAGFDVARLAGARASWLAQNGGAGAGSPRFSVPRNRLEVRLLRKGMELLGVVAAGKLRARTGRHYVGCDGREGCLMAGVEYRHTDQLSEEPGGILWLCTACAERFDRDVRRAQAAFDRQVSGRRGASYLRKDKADAAVYEGRIRRLVVRDDVTLMSGDGR
jgi:hypothetical protein